MKGSREVESVTGPRIELSKARIVDGDTSGTSSVQSFDDVPVPLSHETATQEESFSPKVIGAWSHF